MHIRTRLGFRVGLISAALFAPGLCFGAGAGVESIRPRIVAIPVERQITNTRSGHILTNTGVWSPDGLGIVYDVRSTLAGEQFDGERIELVDVRSGEVRMLYQARNGAHCGVATFHPRENKVVFILGPEFPTKDWEYCAWHRQGVIVDLARAQQALNLDACDLTSPFTPGALRGGSHVHVWDAAGEWVSFTYEDHVLAAFEQETPEHDINLRNIGVSAPFQTVKVGSDHPRNHDGEFFSVIVTRTVAHPVPGSDQIKKACEEAWIGTNGYLRPNGLRQKHALAFQGQVVTSSGETISEVFVADLPDDLRVAGNGPLEGTSTHCPVPPKGTEQKRLTYSQGRKYPGLQGPRHWLRSSPDGSRIAFLMKDDAGVVQLWTVSPGGGPKEQLTRNEHSIASAFTWSPNGAYIAHVLDNGVCITQTQSGETRRLTERMPDPVAPRPEACVFAPDGKRIAYVRPVRMGQEFFNQIFVVTVDD